MNVKSNTANIWEENINVLLVEDCEMIGEIVSSFMEDIPNVNLTIAKNRKATLNALENHSYDVVVLDWYLEHWETTWDIPELIKETKNLSSMVISSSSSADMNKLHMDNWAHWVIDKSKILHFLMGFVNSFSRSWELNRVYAG